MTRLVSSIAFVCTLAALFAACGDDDPANGDTTTDTAADTAPVDTAGGDSSPADTSPADTSPADSSPADTTPADTTPQDTTPNGSDCDFTACGGGDIAGTWTVAGFCTDAVIDNPFAIIPACAAAVFSFEPSASGSIAFAGDNTYTSSFALSGQIHVELDGPCLAAIGGPTCDELAQQLSDAGEVACAAAGGGCTCDGSAGDNATEESGTWSLDGDTLTITPSEGDATSGKLCVAGDTAKYQVVETDEEGKTTTAVFSFTR